MDEDFKKICLQFFRLTFQGQMSRSKFKILKMPCLDLKQAAFDRKLDFLGEVQLISKCYTQRFSFFTLKFKSEVNKYILNKGQRSNQ